MAYCPSYMENHSFQNKIQGLNGCKLEIVCVISAFIDTAVMSNAEITRNTLDGSDWSQISNPC